MEEISPNDPYRNKGGPHGLGDPDDKRLRKIETKVCIPKKMREIARQEKCTQEVEDFTKCCKESNFSMVVQCRPQNTRLWDCLGKWYENEEFKMRCTREYLEERSEYRRTGLSMKERRAKNEAAGA